MYAIYNIVGLKGSVNYHFQDGENPVSQYKRIRRHVGKILEWKTISPENVGSVFHYLKAVNTTPRRMSEVYADYIRDLDGD